MKGWDVCLVFKAPQLDTCHFDLLTMIVHYERVEVTINTSLAGVTAGQFSPQRSGPCYTTPLALNEAYPPPLDLRSKPNYELPPISNRAIAEYIYFFQTPHAQRSSRPREEATSILSYSSTVYNAHQPCSVYRSRKGILTYRRYARSFRSERFWPTCRSHTCQDLVAPGMGLHLLGRRCW